MNWLKEISQEYFTVICVGGGTQINTEFKEQGLPINKHGPLGRETKTIKERQIARDVLESNQANFQDLLDDNGINAVTIIPTLNIGSILCHVNGDVYALAAYHGFDVIYVVTINIRRKEKAEKFKQYPKIEVVSF
jgi:hypothetical protein